MTPQFDTPTNVAFTMMGALPPGQHWSRFDVPGKAATSGNASLLVTTVWNYHWKSSDSGREATRPAVSRDVLDGSLWYRMRLPADGAPPTDIAHWNRITLARESGIPIRAILKDFATSRCSVSDTFECTGIFDDVTGDSIWLRLRPTRALAIEVQIINIGDHIGPVPRKRNLPETDAVVESAVRPLTGNDGQSWLSDSVRRRAVEMYAMLKATQHYQRTWPDVKDVSAWESFDLLCRNGDKELRVEVKGTSTAGAKVLLTRNEVKHARDAANSVALFVVSEILIGANCACSGGTVRVFEPWLIDEKRLEPVAFEYDLA